MKARLLCALFGLFSLLGSGCYRQNPYEQFYRARMDGDTKAMKKAYVEILRDEMDRQWWKRNGGYGDWEPEYGR